MVVTAVDKGNLTVGDQAVLRDIGGTAPNGTTLVSETQLPADTWRPGTLLFAFTNDAVTLTDGLAMRTPNFAWVQSKDTAFNAFDPGQKIAVSEMREQLQARLK